MFAKVLSEAIVPLIMIVGNGSRKQGAGLKSLLTVKWNFLEVNMRRPERILRRYLI